MLYGSQFAVFWMQAFSLRVLITRQTIRIKFSVLGDSHLDRQPHHEAAYFSPQAPGWIVVDCGGGGAAAMHSMRPRVRTISHSIENIWYGKGRKRQLLAVTPGLLHLEIDS